MNKYCLSYEFYIKKILKQINPEMHISKEYIQYINSIIYTLSKKFIKESSLLADKKININNLLQHMRLILSGELNMQCMRFCKKKLKNYRHSLRNNPERMNKATRAKLIFPPSKAKKLMEKHSCKLFKQDNFSILLASIIEFFIQELLEITIDKTNNYKLIVPDLLLAIYDDIDMKEFLLGINFII